MNDLIEFDVIDEHGPQTYRATYDVPANELERVELESIGNSWRPGLDAFKSTRQKFLLY